MPKLEQLPAELYSRTGYAGIYMGTPFYFDWPFLSKIDTYPDEQIKLKSETFEWLRKCLN